MLIPSGRTLCVLSMYHNKCVCVFIYSLHYTHDPNSKIRPNETSAFFKKYIDIYFIIFISLTSLCSLLKVDRVLTLILFLFGFAHEFSACVVRRSRQMP